MQMEIVTTCCATSSLPYGSNCNYCYRSKLKYFKLITLTYEICHLLQWYGCGASQHNNLVQVLSCLLKLMVPVTFGHPWLHHSNHPERAMILTDVVRVLEPAVCTLMLSVRVFTPLPNVRKPKTPVLTF